MSNETKQAVVKVLIQTDACYLFSKKRKPGSRGDRRLEMIGGKVKRDEQPLDALIREASEEEPSGILSTEVERQRPRFMEIDIDGQKHFIGKISVNDARVRSLTHDRKESYGFESIESRVVEDPQELMKPENLSKFTPKTIKIFRQLQLI